MGAGKRSSAAFAAFVGFIVLFSTLMSGWESFDTGRAKLDDDAWTGAAGRVALTGFLKAADAKALDSAANPNPEVMPVTRALNRMLFAKYPRLCAWLVVLGELLLPSGALALVVVKFPGSRALLVVLAALAAFMNVLSLAEGVSSTNPPMAFMWLAIVWIATLAPAAALSYAVDLKSVLGRGTTLYARGLPAPSLGAWLFFLAVFAVIVAGSLAMYWDRLATFAVLTLASVELAIGLSRLNALRGQTAPAGVAAGATRGRIRRPRPSRRGA